MASRSAAAELNKLFERSADPIYVVDARRRIAYVNEACVRWLGRPREELLGVECRYHSASDEHGKIPLGALVCPPPQTFQGESAVATIASPAGAEAARAMEFVPLLTENGTVAAVITMPARTKPLDVEGDSQLSDAARLHARLDRFRRAQGQRYHLNRLIGDSLAMQRVRDQVGAVAATRAAVLVIGPSGSGRQHVARSIHYIQPDASNVPLIPLASPLLSAELLQATIRGLSKSSAATGAHATLLLNDVDHMPSEPQAELSRILRAGESPLRIVATARQPLQELVGERTFDEELASRLTTFVIEVPPLAERLGDLPLLAQTLLEELNAEGSKQLAGFTPEALERLAGYAWPGQIDELAEVVRHAHQSATGPLVAGSDLPHRLFLAADAERRPPRADDTIDLERHLAEIERELIERAIARAKGNKTRAARLLSMTRPRLYRRLVQLGLESETPDFAETDVEEHPDQ
jgi:DNA-binding NtrC family response regulator